jgi:hypothetical protein
VKGSYYAIVKGEHNMSRTYRFKNGYIPWFASQEWKTWVRIEDDEEIDPSWEVRVHFFSWITRRTYLERKLEGKELKKVLSKENRVQRRYFKEPGPHWYRRMTTEVPQRREAKRELKKWMKNPEYEVQLIPKKPLEYWT